MPSKYTWTTDEVKRVHHLASQGVSAVDIARHLGKDRNTTKALTGRISRQGLEKELTRADFAERQAKAYAILSAETAPVPDMPVAEAPNAYRAPDGDLRNRLVLPTLPESVLVIPDLQFPYAQPSALAFLSMVAQRYQCDAVVGIGDEIDAYCLSAWEKDPEMVEPVREIERAVEQCAELFRLFPRAYALHSNHGRGRLEKARVRGGLLRRMVLDYQTLIGAPRGWGFYEEVILGPVLFTHGDGEKKLSKPNLSFDVPRDYGRNLSVVHGHRHEQHGRVADAILVGDEEYWGAYTGCLIDPYRGAFSYTKPKKARLGCLVVHKGQPHRIPYRINPDGSWTGQL